MTAVAIWYEQSDNLLWSVADTRVTGGPGTILTDAAAKLHVLPVVSRPVRQMTGMRSSPYHALRFGFAFAGSTLPALMTLATATSCLSQLEANTTDPPCLRDVSELICRLGTRFRREVAASSSRPNSVTLTIAVFGWCLVMSKFVVHTLVPSDEGDQFALKMQETFPAEQADPIIFGSGRERVIAELQRLREEASSGAAPSRRLPKHAMSKIVREAERTDDVGGSLSIGAAYPTGFELLSHVSPLIVGKPEATMSYNGIDVRELGQVGPFRIALTGVA